MTEFALLCALLVLADYLDIMENLPDLKWEP
jgi:hypothetical protein